MVHIYYDNLYMKLVLREHYEYLLMVFYFLDNNYHAFIFQSSLIIFVRFTPIHILDKFLIPLLKTTIYNYLPLIDQLLSHDKLQRFFVEHIQCIFHNFQYVILFIPQ